MALSENHQNKIHEIQRLVGRNVFIFQHIESCLKLINKLIFNNCSITDIKTRAGIIEKLALGDLLSERQIAKFDSLNSISKPTEITISISLKSLDPQFSEAKKILRSLIKNRNKLVHTFTVDWDLENEIEIDEAKEWLLSQYDAAIAQREVLLEIYKTFHTVVQETVNSEAFRQALKDSLKQ